MNSVKDKNGFSLMEVMIAVAIFSVFITAFISGQGYNIFDSMQLKKDLRLMELCQMKLNEIIVNPPENLKETLLSATKETKPFEKFPDYTYSIEYKKFPTLDMSKLTSTGGGEEGGEGPEEDQNPAQKRIYENIQRNLEKLIWQVSVIVTSKETGAQYELASFLYNQGAKVEFSGI